MIYLNDINSKDFANFYGKKRRSGRKKGSKNSIKRSEVVYRTESSPLQKLKDASIVYRNIVSPTSSLIKSGTSVGNLAYRLNSKKIASVPTVVSQESSRLDKAGSIYDSSLKRVGSTARAANSLRSWLPVPSLAWG